MIRSEGFYMILTGKTIGKDGILLGNIWKHGEMIWYNDWTYRFSEVMVVLL